MVLQGTYVCLRPALERDVDALVRIRSTSEVRARWRGEDITADVRDSVADDTLHLLVIEDADANVVGAIQWAGEEDPEYRHASVDMFLDPTVHCRGWGTDATRTLCHHLLTVEGFHRLTIDPAADNLAAIRCYENVGFHRVGVMRQYERGADGTWHDGLLMDLLADDLQ